MGSNRSSTPTRSTARASTPGCASSPSASRASARSRSGSGWAPARATRPTSRSRARATSSSTCCSRAPRRATRAEIAEAVESVGGDMNAFTGQEITAYYVRVPDRHLDLALDILSDIVWSPALRPDEVESERQVILEEIRMRDDTPDDLVHDVFAEALFPEHPLGREISGSQETISAMTRDADRGVPRRALPARPTWWSRSPATSTTTRSSKLVEAALPATDGDRRAARVNGADGAATRSRSRVARAPARAGAHRARRSRARPRRSRPVRAGGRRPGARRRHELAALPGGPREARPRRTRCSRTAARSRRPARSAVYCGTAPERVDEVLDVVRAELDRLVADGGVTERRARAAPRATSPARWRCRSRARRAACTASAASELTMGEVPSIDWVVERVEAVNARRRRPRHRPRVRRAGERTLARGAVPHRGTAALT